MKRARKLDMGVADVHNDAAVPAPPRKGPKRRKSARGLRLTIHPGGRVDVHHRMSDAQERLCRTSVPLEDDAVRAESANEPVWIQIAKVGHFEGHPAGPFDLTPPIFDEIVRNFAEVDKGEVAFDFEHASAAPPTEGSIPTEGAPAQGWIRRLENRGSAGLWGLVEWLEPARTYIREKKYRHLSPAIRFNARHPVTGKPIGARLTSVALTTRPFLRAMQPLRARDEVAATALGGQFAYSSNEFMPALRLALKLPELATARECGDAVRRLAALYSAAADPAAMVHGVRLGEYLPALRDAVRMPLASTWNQVFDAVSTLIAAAVDEYGGDDEGDEDAELNDEPLDDADTMAATDATPRVEETTDMADAALLKDMEAKNAELTLRLTEAEAKRASADAELKTLRDWKKEREETELKAEVDGAFETYKDTHKLSDAQRADMTVLARANIDAFRRLYPRVSPQHQHLMRDLTGARTADNSPANGTQTDADPNRTKAGTRGKAPPAVEDACALTDRLMREENVSYEEAQCLAARKLGITQLVAH